MPPKVWRVELERDGARVAWCAVVAQTEKWARAVGLVAMDAAGCELRGAVTVVAPLFTIAGLAVADAGEDCAEQSRWWRSAVADDGVRSDSLS